jgi:hypothetical protein
MSRSSLDKVYEKRYGEDFVKKEVSLDNTNNSALTLFSIPFLLIGFLFRLFIVGPSKRMQNTNGAYHVFNGIVILLAHIYILFNIESFNSFLSNYFNDTLPLFSGLVVIYSLVQFVRGILIVGGLNYYRGFAKVDGSAYERGFRSGNQPRSQSYFNGKSEIDSAFSYMNSKMIGMTNSQKEGYMRNFFGGKN